MTRVPMGSNLGDAGWGAVNEKIGERWPIVPQGISAEVIAEEWGLSRESLDEYSLDSHRRAVAAINEGRFEDEIVPVEVGAGGAVVLFAVDETPRRDTSLREACITATRVQGRRCGDSWELELDRRRRGGDAHRERDAVDRHWLEPRARWVSFGLFGVDPYRMLHGNPDACARRSRRPGSDRTTSRSSKSTRRSPPSCCSSSPTRGCTSGGSPAT